MDTTKPGMQDIQDVQDVQDRDRPGVRSTRSSSRGWSPQARGDAFPGGGGRPVRRGPRRIASAFIALVMAVAVPAALSAQDTEDDPFDLEAFDSGVTAAVGSGEGVSIEFLAGGTVVPAFSAVVPGLPGGADGYQATGTISGKLFGKVTVPKYGSLFASWGVSQRFLQGSGGTVVLPPRDPYSPLFSLSELHYSFDIDKAVFLRAGNQLVSWGPSRIWTPVDFINIEKADPFRSVDLRVGKPGIRAHLPLRSSNLFLFADLSASVDPGTGLVRNLARSTAFALRYDFAAGGFETGLTLYGGLETRPKGGLDVSGRLFGTTVYGEVAAAPAHGSLDGSWMASIGAERALGELRKVTASAEFFYRSDGEDDSSAYPLLVARGEFSPLYSGSLYGYASIGEREAILPGLSTSFSALANLSDRSYLLRLSGSIDIPGVPPFSLVLGWTGGGAGKAFTFYSGDATLSATLQTRIEF